MSPFTHKDHHKRLAELFSGYRAEWINEEIYNLFTEPSYFPQLVTSHPCFLVGGRGTGKTTVLRCLSYQGQSALKEQPSESVSRWPFYGMYYRINTNRVTAFKGPELSESTWTRVFAHYINLEFCELLANFLHWFECNCSGADILSQEAIGRVATTLNLQEIKNLEELRQEVSLSKLRFEAGINNVADGSEMPLLSMQGAPIDMFVKEIKGLPHFRGKIFFFLIDEYENLDRYQQRVLNTLVKHCGELYSFKVGVRELGLRERSTINPMEQLAHPADYRLIDITVELSERFDEFAAGVCERRLARVLDDSSRSPNIQSMLPELTAEDESRILGVEILARSVVEEINSQPESGKELQEWLDAASPLEVFVLSLRAEAEGRTTFDKLLEVVRNPVKWNEQYGNYMHSCLFAIRKGKRGIRKYFAGWRVYCLLAGSNIRYLLELVDQAFRRHLDDGRDLFEDPVAAENQTRAAQEAGHTNLRELEGLSLSGAKLTRLLLGLGRVFQVMAEDPVGHTPEVNQFHLSTDIMDEELRGKVEDLLREGIMHLALLRYRGSKLQQETDIRQFDYVVHPIFSPFFGFSHRRKRKIEIKDHDIWDLVEKPRQSIRRIVNRQNRILDDELPEQMSLFVDYYGSSDS